MSGKAPSNYKRRSFGIPHVSKSLSPNVACPGSSLKQLVSARERGWNVILAPRFQTLLAGIFQTKEQSEPKEHTVSSCNIVVLSSEKKCVRESSPFAVWNCSLNVCIEFLVMLSPPPRAVGAAGTAWIWITKRRSSLCSLWLYVHAPDAIVFVSSFLPLSLYCSFPLSLLIFESFLTLSKAPSLIVDTKSSSLFR